MKVIRMPDFRARIEGVGLEIYGNTPAEFEQQILQNVKIYHKVAADAHIEPE